MPTEHMVGPFVARQAGPVAVVVDSRSELQKFIRSAENKWKSLGRWIYQSVCTTALNWFRIPFGLKELVKRFFLYGTLCSTGPSTMLFEFWGVGRRLGCCVELWLPQRFAGAQLKHNRAAEAEAEHEPTISQSQTDGLHGLVEPVTEIRASPLLCHEL